METTIKGRSYQVAQMETGYNTRADMLKRGWDGFMYMLTGKRGAAYMGFRSAKTGEFHIVSSI